MGHRKKATKERPYFNGISLDPAISLRWVQKL